MAKIRLEWVPIKRWALGSFGVDHLQLTNDRSRPSATFSQDDWYVMEGLFDNVRSVLPKLVAGGASGVRTLSQAYGKTGHELIDEIGTPSDRYAAPLAINTTTNVGWTTMAEYGQGINNGEFEYYAFSFDYAVSPTQNSSSVISSLLWQVGVDANDFGSWSARTTFGLSTYIGSGRDDTLTLPTINFTTLSGGLGNDTLSGFDVTTFGRTEKYYGGKGDDRFNWSGGFNVYHGGDPRIPYGTDGVDRISYNGAGVIRFDLYKPELPGYLPEFVVRASGGDRNPAHDWLTSIYEFEFSNGNDRVIAGKGVTITYGKTLFKLGEGSESGNGDEFDFGEAAGNLKVTRVSASEYTAEIGDPALGGTWWISESETIIGTANDDIFYLPEDILSVEGGSGNDVIDARRNPAGGETSAGGYAIELRGGSGNDVLIAGAGRTFADGGEGNDDFVVSALSTEGAPTELVIQGGDSSDRLYVSYGFFDGNLSEFDSSRLFRLTGAVSFEDAAENYIGYFAHQTQQQGLDNPDLTDGLVSFAGHIEYTRDGDDLLISLFPGIREETLHPEVGPGGEDVPGYAATTIDPVYIRVVGYQEGDFGLRFPTVTFSDDQIQGLLGSVASSPDWDAAVASLITPDIFAPALGEQPTAPEYEPQGRDDAQPKSQLIGSLSADTIGSSDDDPKIVFAEDGDDVVTTGDGDDELYGGDGDDRLSSGRGDDILDGGGGADVMSGGTGNDRYFVDSVSDRVVENAGQGLDTVEAGISFVLPDNVENLTLTGTALTGRGNAAANTLVGNAEANVLTGGDGNDTLYGAGGSDILEGEAGSDDYAYFDGDGAILIRDNGPATDTDTLYLAGEATADGLRVYRIESAPDDLVIDFRSGGRVTIEGFMRGEGIEKVLLQNDIELTRADLLAMAPPLLNGIPARATNDDSIFLDVSAGAIPAEAFLYNDLGNGLRILAVGPAANAAVELDAAGDVVITAAEGYFGTVGFDYTVVDENGTQSTASAIVNIRGREISPDVHLVIGNEAADDLRGSAEDDLIVAGGGSDMVDGGDGSDTLDYTGATGAVAIDLSLGSVSERADHNGAIVSTDIVAAVENAVGSHFGDIIYGSADSNVLWGNGGNDLIDGRGGADVVYGGQGDDGFYVDDAGDLVVEVAGEGRDRITTSVSFELGAGQSIEILASRGVAGISLTGNELNNTLQGATGQETLTGGAGNDTLNGLAGADLMYGGAGSDAFYVDDPGDLVFESAGEGTDRVATTVSYELQSGQSVEVLFANGVAGLSLTGNELANTLIGHTGSETLDGGAGTDVLTGRTGSDVFKFRDGWGVDRITDFEDNIDVIDLTGVTGLETFDQLVVAQSGSSALLSFNGQTVVVWNTNISDLQDDVLL